MTTETKTTGCPECGSQRFGQSDGQPVTTGGWRGDVEYTWGRYAGVHLPKATAKRCPDCGHVQSIDPDFD